MAQFTKYTGTITGEASALITVLDAILVTGEGWTKPYTGANKAAYLQAAGNGFYLRVDDSGPGAGTFKEARILGYETMSDVDTGTGLFPTAAQMANGMFCRKSVSADATARSYIAFADDRTFYLFIFTADVANVAQGIGFGDFYSYVPADGYRTCIVGNGTENSASGANMIGVQAALSPATTAHYIARAYTGTGTSLNNNATTDYIKNGAALYLGGGGASSVTYPNPSDGGLFLAPVWLADPTTVPLPSIRGEYRGLWCPCHNQAAALATGDTFSGTGALAGKTFEIINGVRNASSTGFVAIETSNTLNTN